MVIGIDILTFNTFIQTHTTQACSVLTHYSVKRLVVAAVMSLPVSVSVLSIGIGTWYWHRWRSKVSVSVVSVNSGIGLSLTENAISKTDNSSLNITYSARNLGFIFDEHLTSSDQISSLSKSCYSHIREHRCIQKLSIITCDSKQPFPSVPILSNPIPTWPLYRCVLQSSRVSNKLTPTDTKVCPWCCSCISTGTLCLGQRRLRAPTAVVCICSSLGVFTYRGWRRQQYSEGLRSMGRQFGTVWPDSSERSTSSSSSSSVTQDQGRSTVHLQWSAAVSHASSASSDRPMYAVVDASSMDCCRVGALSVCQQPAIVPADLVPPLGSGSRGTYPKSGNSGCHCHRVLSIEIYVPLSQMQL